MKNVLQKEKILEMTVRF